MGCVGPRSKRRRAGGAACALCSVRLVAELLRSVSAGIQKVSNVLVGGTGQQQPAERPAARLCSPWPMGHAGAGARCDAQSAPLSGLACGCSATSIAPCGTPAAAAAWGHAEASRADVACSKEQGRQSMQQGAGEQRSVQGGAGERERAGRSRGADGACREEQGAAGSRQA